MSLIIVGHRGVAGHYPENTRASFQAAIEMGLSWIEFDVQPSQDGQLVVYHDPTLERCSNGQGRVDQHSLAELKQLDLGRWYGEEFAGEKILTLGEVLRLAEAHGIGVNIEVKIDQHDPIRVAGLLRAELDHCGLSKDQILLSSFSHDMLEQLAEQCPGYRLAVLSDELCEQDWHWLKKLSAFGCNLHIDHISQADIDALHQHGYQVWCFTVNQPSQIEQLCGLDAIFSDYPGRFTGS